MNGNVYQQPSASGQTYIYATSFLTRYSQATPANGVYFVNSSLASGSTMMTFAQWKTASGWMLAPRLSPTPSVWTPTCARPAGSASIDARCLSRRRPSH